MTVAASSDRITGQEDSGGGVCVVTAKRPKPADLKRLALGQRFGWEPRAALVGRPLDLASGAQRVAQPQGAVAPASPRVPPARRKPGAALQVVVVSRGTAPLLNVQEAAAALRVSPVMLSDWLLDAPVVDVEALKAWRAAWAPRADLDLRGRAVLQIRAALAKEMKERSRPTLSRRPKSNSSDPGLACGSATPQASAGP